MSRPLGRLTQTVVLTLLLVPCEGLGENLLAFLHLESEPLPDFLLVTPRGVRYELLRRWGELVVYQQAALA